MISLTKKQKLFLAVYPFVHLIIAVGFLAFGISSGFCLDPEEDMACREQGTFIGLLRIISISLAGILMAPGIMAERFFVFLSKIRIGGVIDYFFIFLSGYLYGIIFLMVYKVLIERKNGGKT